MIAGPAILLAAWLYPAATAGIAWWMIREPWDLRPEVTLTEPIDRLVVYKDRRRMIAYRGDRAIKGFSVGLGFAPEGEKFQQGDGRTPEGSYRIDRRNPNSDYHLSLGIDYPQPDHRRRARAAGVSPGGDIFIHGQPNVRKGKPDLRGDWTAGCLAVTDAEIEELWEVVAIGTRVEILP